MKQGILSIIGLLVVLVFLGCDEIGDTTPPIVNILYPYEGASISEDTVKIMATATDMDSEIREVRFYVDSEPLSVDPAEDDNEYSCIWITTSLESGSSHNIVAEAEDEAGNIGSDTVGVTIAYPTLAKLIHHW